MRGAGATRATAQPHLLSSALPITQAFALNEGRAQSLWAVQSLTDPFPVTLSVDLPEPLAS